MVKNKNKDVIETKNADEACESIFKVVECPQNRIYITNKVARQLNEIYHRIEKTGRVKCLIYGPNNIGKGSLAAKIASKYNQQLYRLNFSACPPLREIAIKDLFEKARSQFEQLAKAGNRFFQFDNVHEFWGAFKNLDSIRTYLEILPKDICLICTSWVNSRLPLDYFDAIINYAELSLEESKNINFQIIIDWLDQHPGYKFDYDKISNFIYSAKKIEYPAALCKSLQYLENYRYTYGELCGYVPYLNSILKREFKYV